MKEVVRELDSEARVFLFGSVAGGEHVISSDIDILIISRLEPALLIAHLRRAGFEEPFEFHVAWAERAELYLRSIGVMREI
ncbi:MAG: nucleotidyltransferase domain-containing protein [Nitrososphaerota archaeon]